MTTTAIFNAGGTVSIRVSENKTMTFTSVSAAVNFCREYGIIAYF